MPTRRSWGAGSGAPRAAALRVLSPPVPPPEDTAPLRRLLTSKYAERESLERARLSRPLALHDFPLLLACLSLTGLLPCAAPARAPFYRRRAPRAAAYALLATAPYLPGLFLPACPPHCDAPAGGSGCGACVTTFSAGRLLLDLIFTVAIISEGPSLAHTLHDVYHASHLNRAEIQAFAKPCSRLFLGVFVALWVLLPVLDVASALAGRSGAFSVSRGDLATRALWVAAGPARAALMTGVMASIIIVMRLHSFDLKAVRAAAALAAADVARGPAAAVAYYAALLSALSVNTRLLNTTSVRLQALVSFLLLYGLQNIMAIGLFYFSNAASLASVDATDAQKQSAILEELLHDGSFVLMALIALGSAAHLTALCDSTARALAAGLSAHLAAWIAALPPPAVAPAGGGDAAAAEEMLPEAGAAAGGATPRARMAPEVAQEAALLAELIGNAAESVRRARAYVQLR
jgi:hypothetical protein